MGDWLAAARVRWTAGSDPRRLVEVIVRDRNHAVREQALVVLERLWIDHPDRRAEIWSAVWYGNENPPAEIIRFLLAGGPRMVTYLREDTLWFSGYLRDVPARIVWLARRNTDVAALLATTGEPRLLAALEAAFVEGFHHHASYSSDIPFRLLWDDDRQTPLLRMLLANPHLPRPAGDDLELAALMALKRRYDLMTGFDGHDLVFRLLEMLRYEPPAPAVDALRLALRAFPPGPARDSVCWWAMGLNDEATAAAVEAGYRPGEPDLVPIFLVLTGQWSSTDDDSALYDFIVGGGLDDRRAGPRPVGHLVELADTDGRAMPAAVVRALKDLGAGDARDTVCDAAEWQDGFARRIVVEAGYVPSDPQVVPAFLYLTRQWARYDAADPDGSLLRAYVDTLQFSDFERDHLCEAAAEAGRPMPCDPRRVSMPDRYRPGGTGIAGTGGFSAH
ncbi:MAG: hypothetical protein SYR96_25165 [Actinomycetota bacterium]|nr:hypothetical protein [Actinomycetota bacterium]